MTEYLTEQEQIEQLKKWLRMYGLPALIGVLAGIVIFYGWHYYQDYRSRTLTHASRVYDEMLTDRAHSNTEGAQVQAEKLLSHYPSTPYGQMAALMLAHEAATQQNYPQALEKLSWVLGHSDQAAVRQIARLRIGRIHLAQQQPEETLKVLKKVEDSSFNSLINEVVGDAQLALHHPAEAQEAYKQALQDLPHSEEIRPLLEMKLDNLVAG